MDSETKDKTDTGTGSGAVNMGTAPVAAGADITLYKGCVLSQEDSVERDSGTYAMFVGDMVETGVSESAYIQTDDGGNLQVRPGSAATVELLSDGTVCFRIEYGTIAYTAGRTAVPTRKKLLRTPAVVMTAAGTTFEWNFNAVKALSTVSVFAGSGVVLWTTGLNPNLDWTIDAGYSAQFNESMAARPIPERI